MLYILHLIFAAAHWVITLLNPILIPLCFVFAWGLLGLIGWNMLAATRDSLRAAQRMHQIPCADCRFFTGSYHLKCTLHPKIALSEEAINCRDYERNTEWMHDG
jgi:hypothetical protein